MEQMTIDDVECKVEHECRNCQYWELLPINEQKEGWGIDGYCNVHRENMRYWTRCPEFSEITDEPSWVENLKNAPNRGFAINLKEILFGWNVNLSERKIYNKHNVEIHGYEHTFQR